jgi:hypothetical protein
LQKLNQAQILMGVEFYWYHIYFQHSGLSVPSYHRHCPDLQEKKRDIIPAAINLVIPPPQEEREAVSGLHSPASSEETSCKYYIIELHKIKIIYKREII